MKTDLCYFCSKDLDTHTKDELIQCAFDIVKGVSET